MQSTIVQRTLLISPPTSSVRPELRNTLREGGFVSMAVGSIQELATQSSSILETVVGIVLDLTAWPVDGLAVLRQVRDLTGELPILAVSTIKFLNTHYPPCDAGAADYLVRPFSDQELVRRVKDVISARRTKWIRVDQAAPPAGLSQLTRCERRVLEGVLWPKTTKQISSELHIGPQTVAKHKQRVLRKMGARNDVALVLQILASGPGMPPGLMH